MEQPSILTDRPQRLLNALLEDTIPNVPKNWCWSCKTEISYRAIYYINDVIDEKKHEIIQVQSGGEVDPVICPLCGAVNIFTPPPEGEEWAQGGKPEGFEWRRVLSVSGEDVPTKEDALGDTVVDYDALIGCVDPLLDIKFKQQTRGRPLLKRVEWLDYFHQDPVISLAKERKTCQHVGMHVVG